MKLDDPHRGDFNDDVVVVMEMVTVNGDGGGDGDGRMVMQ